MAPPTQLEILFDSSSPVHIDIIAKSKLIAGIGLRIGIASLSVDFGPQCGGISSKRVVFSSFFFSIMYRLKLLELRQLFSYVL